MSLSKPRIKNPTYELFRYDIRPDVMGAALESELVGIFNAVQDDPNVEWITWAFETVKEYDGTARPFSKHCHVCWKVKKATRADRSGFKVHRFRLKHQLAACAIRFTGRKTWCSSDQWLAGYVQKDGQACGNAPDMVEAWWSHANERKRPMKRNFEVTKNNVLNVMQSVYCTHRDDIERLAKHHCSSVGADMFDVTTYMAVVLRYDMKCWKLIDRIRVHGMTSSDWQQAKMVLHGFKDLSITDGLCKHIWKKRKRDGGGTFLGVPPRSAPTGGTE